MTSFDSRMSLSDEFKKALYSELKSHGYNLRGPYRNATHDEDAFDKVDVWYNINGVDVPVQLRVYKKEYSFPGFPIRDTELQTGSEMSKLKAGELDDYLFAYATAVRQEENAYGRYKFLSIKIVKGSALRENVDKIVGERSFKEGKIRRHDFYEETENHVSFIADPASTVYLRNWK